MENWKKISAMIALALAVGCQLGNQGPEPLQQRSSEVVDTDENIKRACSILCCRSSSQGPSSAGCGQSVSYDEFAAGERISCNCELKVGYDEERLVMQWIIILSGVK